MKRFTAILLLAVLFLQSCGREEFASTERENETDSVQYETEADSNADDTIKPEHPETTISSYNIDLDNLSTAAPPGITNTTLRHTADITSFKTGEQVSEFLTAPRFCIVGEKTYIVRNFPEELNDPESIDEYRATGVRPRDIEIYTGHDYSEPTEVIELKGLDGRKIPYDSFSYDPETDKFYIISREKVSGEEDYTLNLYIFSSDGELEYFRILSKILFAQYRVYGGELYFLSNAKLMIEDMKTAEQKVIDEGVVQYFESDDVTYYIKNELNDNFEMRNCLYSYDRESGKTQKLFSIDTDERFETAAYDAATETVYFSNFNSLCSYRRGEVKTLVSTNDTVMHVEKIHGGQVIILVGHNQLAVYQIPENPTSIEEQQIPLRLCSFTYDQSAKIPPTGGALQSSVLENMNATGISVRGEYAYFTNDMDEYVNTMARKLLAGDTDFDFFYVTTEMVPLFKKAFYEDLTKYSGVNKYMDELLPGIKELCTIDGKLAMVPTSIIMRCMSYDPSKIEGEFELPTLYDELWEETPELAEGACYMGESSEEWLLDIWFDQLAANYMAKVIDDDTALEDLETLYTDMTNLTYNEAVDLESGSMNQNAFLSIVVVANSSNVKGRGFYPLIKLGEEYKHAAEGQFLAINPASLNKDLAAAYLIYYLDWWKNSEYGYKYYFEGGYDPERTYSITEEKYEVLKEQLADSVRAVSSFLISDDFFWHVNEKFDDIDDGKLTPAQAAEQTLRYLKMMRDE